MTDFGGKTSIFSHPVYLFLRKFSLQDSRGGSVTAGWRSCAILSHIKFFQSPLIVPCTFVVKTVDCLLPAFL
ncbi:hypothetical protein AWP80_07090 [Escherichia coli]|nr:hypothetical protein AWP80_07090 [Escherichia coli]